jgi:glutamate--glyoxylate aminotransferase
VQQLLAAGSGAQQTLFVRGQSVLAQPSNANEPKSLNSKDGKVLHPELLNELVLATQYAVRGELYLRAEQLRKEGKDIIFTNVGNPHALGAKPLTFTRQVRMSCSLIDCIGEPPNNYYNTSGYAGRGPLHSSFSAGST